MNKAALGKALLGVVGFGLSVSGLAADMIPYDAQGPIAYYRPVMKVVDGSTVERCVQVANLADQALELCTAHPGGASAGWLSLPDKYASPSPSMSSFLFRMNEQPAINLADGSGHGLYVGTTWVQFGGWLNAWYHYAYHSGDMIEVQWNDTDGCSHISSFFTPHFDAAISYLTGTVGNDHPLDLAGPGGVGSVEEQGAMPLGRPLATKDTDYRTCPGGIAHEGSTNGHGGPIDSTTPVVNVPHAPFRRNDP